MASAAGEGGAAQRSLSQGPQLSREELGLASVDENP